MGEIKLCVIDGGRKAPVTVSEWEAESAVAVGAFMARYIARNPPPGESSMRDDLAQWADNLIAWGEREVAA